MIAKLVLSLFWVSIHAATSSAQGVWGFCSSHSVSVIDCNKPSHPKVAIIPIEQPVPTYPFEMMRQGFGAQVTVRVHLTEDGTVSNAEVVSATKDDFAEPTLKAIRQWKFRAYTAGERIPPNSSQEYRFVYSLVDE